MKYYYQIEGLLRNNIGDVLQGIAAKAFLEEPEVVDREALSEIQQKESAFLIANGWYLHSFEHFPPPENVTPLYLSVHIAKSALLQDKRVREHFKRYAPIGCRDKKTRQLFLGWGIPAYYSSCLTTTTKSRLHAEDKKTDEVLLVDGVDHPVPEYVKNKLEELAGKAIIRVSHDPSVTAVDFKTYNEIAERDMNDLLARYCRASLVITTKIHCALPCLGMGANVLMIHPTPSEMRIDVVREFMEIIPYTGIMNAKALPVPQVNKVALTARQQFLSAITQKSISIGKNAVAYLPEYQSLKKKSQLHAKTYQLALKAMYRLGIARKKIEQVYGIL